MRVVLIHRYFAPDTPPYAHILHRIALRLGEEGHQVSVLTCQPSYNRQVVGSAPRREQLAPGVDVRRWRVIADRSSGPAKVLNLVIFCARILASPVLIRRADVVMAASTPPIAVAKAAKFMARVCGARFVYHKQDIYPEVALATGMLAPGRAERLLRRADTRTDRKADAVVVLSADMAATELRRGVPEPRIRVINNFDPWPAADQHRDSDGAGVRVVFAGNLGRFQGLPTLLEAIEAVGSRPDLEFDFVGDGPLRPDVEALADRLDSVQCHGYQTPEWVAEFLSRHQPVGVVSLEPGVVRAAYPSKTLTYLKESCPLLVVAEPDSELATRVVAAGAGLQADPGDAGAVAARLTGLADDPAALGAMRQAASRLYQQEFRPERRLDEWMSLFASMSGGLQPIR